MINFNDIIPTDVSDLTDTTGIIPVEVNDLSDGADVSKSYADTPLNAVKASATLEFDGSGTSVQAGDIVTIDGKVYTYVAALTAAPGVEGEVLIGTDDTTALAHLYEAINDIGISYGLTHWCTVHPTCEFKEYHGSNGMTIQAKIAGVAGNSLAVTTDVANAQWQDDAHVLTATLVGGINGTVGKVGDRYFPMADNTHHWVAVADNTIVDANWVFVLTNADDLRCEEILSSEVELFAATTVATGTLELTGVIALGKVVTIDSETYTFVAAEAAPFEVTVGATDAESFANLLAAINDDSALVTAVLNLTTITLTTILQGTSANYTLTTDAAGITVSGALLTGGTTVFSLTSPNAFLTINEDSDLSLPDTTTCKRYRLKINQDAVGGHDVTITSTLPILYEGGIGYTVTAAANALDKLVLYTNGTEWELEDVMNDLKV